MGEFYNSGAMRTLATPPPHRPASRAGAFTLVELLVVAGVILLVLGIGVPAFKALSAQAQRNQARQLVSGLLNRAAIVAATNGSRAAVRFAPAEWLVQADETSASASAHRGRQAAALYEERTFVGDPEPDDSQVEFIEDQRLEQVGDVAPVVLPGNLWVAPAEATAGFLGRVWLGSRDGPRVVWPERLLQGTIGHFALDPVRDPELLSLDDFVVVFDAQTGLLPGVWGSTVVAWPLFGYDPVNDVATAGVLTRRQGRFSYFPRYQRFGAGAIVFYDRESFISLGPSAVPRVRRDVLRRGQVFDIGKLSGTLSEREGLR